MDQWVYEHIVYELIENGANVEVMNCFGVDFSIEDFNELIVKKAKDNSYDLIFTDLNGNYLLGDMLLELGRLGIPKLLICFDSVVIPDRHNSILKYFELVWVFSSDNKDRYIGNGANKLIVQPYACNPSFARIPDDHLFEKNYMINKLCFLGSPYGSRVNLINEIIENDIELDLYYSNNKSVSSSTDQGKTPIKSMLEYVRNRNGRRIILAKLLNYNTSGNLDLSKESVSRFKSVPPLHQAELYHKYSLALAFSSARNTDILKRNVPIINLRTFEIAMSGGAQIIRRNDELESHFIENEEIIFYDTNEELIDKIKYYMRDGGNKLKEIKLQAKQRALNDHTWQNRFDRIYKIIGIDSVL